jgi:Kef-type K+ transport system membrane component KefB
MKSAQSLLVVLALALLAPLVSDAIRRLIVPVAVVEVLLGIAFGPQGLGLIEVDTVTSALSTFGLLFLFFLAGLEIDFERIAGRPLRVAAAGWLISFGLALGVAALLGLAGLEANVLYLGLALCTTALGTLLPILGDAGAGESMLGRYVMAAGAVGEFVPIVLIATLLNSNEKPLSAVLSLNLFVIVVLIGLWAARKWKPPHLTRIIRDTMHTSGQVAVRMSMVLIAGAAYLAVRFGLESLLGAFAAGIMAAQVLRRLDTPAQVKAVVTKYEAVGFGLLIPVYFIITGAKFDLDALLANPWLFALVAVFLLLMLAVRGLPTALLARPGLDGPPLPLALLTATQLPLVVTITGEAVKDGHMTAAIASAMVGAAMLSVLVFPTLALSGGRRSRVSVAVPEVAV